MSFSQRARSRSACRQTGWEQGLFIRPGEQSKLEAKGFVTFWMNQLHICDISQYRATKQRLLVKWFQRQCRDKFCLEEFFCCKMGRSPSDPKQFAMTTFQKNIPFPMFQLSWSTKLERLQHYTCIFDRLNEFSLGENNVQDVQRYICIIYYRGGLHWCRTSL